MSLARAEFAQMEAALMVSGEMFTDNIQRYKGILDTTLPVLNGFTVETTPPGFPPEEIRQEWVGLTLPVRFTIDIEQVPEVPVIAVEALHELERAGRHVARDWWREYYAQEARRRVPNIDDEGHADFLANVSLLVFDPSCGTLHRDPNAQLNEFIAGLVNPFYWWDGQREWRGAR